MTTFEVLKKTHFVVVTVFYLIYLIKTLLLVFSPDKHLPSFTKKTKVLEMIISFAFLATGIYLMTQIPEIKSVLIIKISLILLSIPLAVVGFKKKKNLLAIFSLVLLTTAFGLAEMGKAKNQAVIPTKNADAQPNGKEMYINNCAVCHGLNGKAGITGASDLSLSNISSDSISNIIESGRNMMKPINGFNDQQRKAISDYILNEIKGK